MRKPLKGKVFLKLLDDREPGIASAMYLATSKFRCRLAEVVEVADGETEVSPGQVVIVPSALGSEDLYGVEVLAPVRCILGVLEK
jgi:hypothetical protein